MLEQSRIEDEGINRFDADGFRLEFLGSWGKDNVILRHYDGRYDERDRIVWALTQEPTHAIKPSATFLKTSPD